MKASDIRVEEIDLRFADEPLAVPLQLSKGAIYESTYVQAAIIVSTRDGRQTQGTGSILLSDLWAFPNPVYSHSQKDGVMRDLCRAFAAALRNDDYGDPLEKGYALEEQLLPRITAQVEAATAYLVPGAIPRLAALNCLAPFDAALHDAWGRALGGSTFRHYTAEHLNANLSAYLGPEFRRRYPDEFLVARRQRLGVQHVVGLGEPLTPADVTQLPALGLPANLQNWIIRDNVTCFKIKLRGHDPHEDAQRVAAVYGAASNIAASLGFSDAAVRLALDPNEGYADTQAVLAMLDHLAVLAPAALTATDYLEQPTSRNFAAYTYRMHEIARRLPVLIDESLDSVAVLEEIRPYGWSGLSVKTCKGQTASLLAYCWARHHGLYLTLQDLTCPGLALVHSANLCAHLALSVDYFECNSRQFMPAARPQERAAYPDYFSVRQGSLHLPPREEDGLY